MRAKCSSGCHRWMTHLVVLDYTENWYLLAFSFYKAKRYKECKEIITIVEGLLAKYPNFDIASALNEIKVELEKMHIDDGEEQMECSDESWESDSSKGKNE